jgi:hypothetical protein
MELIGFFRILSSCGCILHCQQQVYARLHTDYPGEDAVWRLEQGNGKIVLRNLGSMHRLTAYLDGKIIGETIDLGNLQMFDLFKDAEDRFMFKTVQDRWLTVMPQGQVANWGGDVHANEHLTNRSKFQLLPDGSRPFPGLAWWMGVLQHPVEDDRHQSQHWNTLCDSVLQH